jgi:predicted GIY-YIG superfamily endonuclease
MSFWVYFLRCSDDSYYVGHTDDLERRLGAHNDATLPCYTSTRRPVTLIWSQEFVTREEALAAEWQIKGWSRAKEEGGVGSRGLETGSTFGVGQKESASGKVALA